VGEAVLKDLIERTRAGDLDAFEELVQECHRPMVAFLLLVGVHENDIQDVAQDVFFAVYKGVSRYDASLPFLKWARGIARNTARTYFSTQRRREEVHRQFRSQVRAEIADAEPGASAFDTPHSEHLEGCIERLTENQKRVLDCRYKQGMTSRRIAEVMDMKAITVRQMLARMRAALRDCLTGKLEAQGA
jgi:RNA polymerase sigma-70 factor (ECF subfamily)